MKLAYWSKLPLFSLVLLAGGMARAAAPGPNALPQYLSKPDPSYKWREVSRRTLDHGIRLIELSLDSQTWHGIRWRHHLLIVEPPPTTPASQNSRRTGLMMITGDYDRGIMARLLLPEAARRTGSVCAVLYDVSNQPLFGKLREDDLIAYSLQQALRTSDPTWALLFPMTRSATAAMTAIQEFEGKHSRKAIDRFIVTGASKRGWTTWLTGANDRRVIGIAPIVYNNLNVPAQMKHQIDTWGHYSEQIQAYVKAGLLQHLDTPQGRAMAALIDPFSMRNRLSIPKLMVDATNDRYWTLDAADFYYPALAGEKYLYYVPNSPHQTPNVLPVARTIEAFCIATAAGKTLPKITATGSEQNGKAIIQARSDRPTRSMVAWVALSQHGDFRESRWDPVPLAGGPAGYHFTRPIPAGERIAIFVQGSYELQGIPYELSSPLVILP